MFLFSREILLIFSLFLLVTAFPIDLEGFMGSLKELNPPFATSFINCNDVDFGMGRSEEVRNIKKLFGCTYNS
ncbi:hypothetical protein RB195_004803 [Necator americanus]|uniref:SCP domain-containing protein n=1 Tax=Necator americanus TaxID=51031 RepID=A0ABR1BP44_NECAM